LVKAKVLASLVIDDEVFDARGDAQLKLDLIPPEVST
jgi:hypothetical protein